MPRENVVKANDHQTFVSGKNHTFLGALSSSLESWWHAHFLSFMSCRLFVMASQRNHNVPGISLNCSLSNIKPERTSGADRGELLRKNRARGIGKKEAFDNSSCYTFNDFAESDSICPSSALIFLWFSCSQYFCILISLAKVSVSCKFHLYFEISKYLLS